MRSSNALVSALALCCVREQYDGNQLAVVVRRPDHRHRRLLRPRRERKRGRAPECSQQCPPSDGDCHTPLPCEVRKGKDATPRECSLPVQEGQDAGCFDLSLRLQLHCFRRQLLANAAIAASRVAA